jgi:N-acetylmuramic acid 6-phosphate etherase
MIRLGRTWSNLMVDVVATNAKLRGRVLRILQEASGAGEDESRTALEQAGGELKPALLSMLAGVGAAEARAAIAGHNGSVAAALQALQAHQGQPALPDSSTTTVTSTIVPTGETA